LDEAGGVKGAFNFREIHVDDGAGRRLVLIRNSWSEFGSRFLQLFTSLYTRLTSLPGEVLYACRGDVSSGKGKSQRV
jgi:hypothetical protein